ncbi:MAG: dockerin type I domain-containing protein [Oscillospiraceae bacterium]|jgi:hypothetical protein|nr:dockerin type I domain-containing protein [Oscillospiraceae bacterium]
MKKILFVFAIFAFIVGFPINIEKISAETVEVTKHIVGDIDGDYKFTDNDIKLLQAWLDENGEMAVNDIAGDSWFKYALDYTKDGYVTEKDAQSLYYHIVFKGSIFEVYEYTCTPTFSGYYFYCYSDKLGENIIIPEYPVYIVGDLTRDEVVDEADYGTLYGVLYADNASFEILDRRYVFDVNRDGNFDNEDIVALADVVNGVAPIMAFKWDKAKNTPSEYFEFGWNKNENKIESVDVIFPPKWYVIGDVTGNGSVNADDLWFFQGDLLYYGVKSEYPLQKNDKAFYVFDVDRNGIIDDNDYQALSDMVHYGGEVYRFYWDKEKNEPYSFEYHNTIRGEFSTATTSKTTTTRITVTSVDNNEKEECEISIESVTVIPSAEDIENGYVNVKIPVYIKSPVPTPGVMIKLEFSGVSEGFDLSIEDGEYSTDSEGSFGGEFFQKSSSEPGYKYAVSGLYGEMIMNSTEDVENWKFSNKSFVLFVLNAQIPVENKDVTVDVTEIYITTDDFISKPQTQLPGDFSFKIRLQDSVSTYGDFNGDDILSMADLVMLYQHLNGKREFNQYQRMAADIVKDNSINVLDLAYFRREMLKSKGIYD